MSRTVVALGNFDGVHRGHQALLTRAKALASTMGAVAGVVTFEPHPVKVLAPHLAPPLILRPDEKARALKAYGAEVVDVVPFDAVVAAMAPQVFARDVLQARCGAVGVVVVVGFRFGHKASGTVDDLRAVFGDDAVEVDAVKEGDLVCSSTKVRELVMLGHVEAAALLLGRPYFVEGEVIRGDGRGRTIGIPTAIVESGRELLPQVGVYASRVVLDDRRVVRAVTNVGLRPTFAGQGVRIEAHLLDFAEDLYGRRVSVDLVARLRDEQRFSGVDALVAQIKSDIDSARALLA